MKDIYIICFIKQRVTAGACMVYVAFITFIIHEKESDEPDAIDN